MRHDTYGKQIQLNLAVTVAVARACKAESISNVGIKWPNDVWISGSKVAGILVDYSGQGFNGGAVVGVGINVNEQLLGSLDKVKGKNTAISLRDAKGGSIVPRERVLAVMLAELENLMSVDLDTVIEEFSRLDILVGNAVRVHHKSKETNDPRDYNAKVLKITQGGLVVKREDTGKQKTLSSEEISISKIGG
eukprot:CAMPEP_0184503806 /NCGR_PEP_ID=MMETSP0113_2-20130426/52105_1 /TAXON_ID=91329 /ORGANISM="Norrisiella sphaerica, Strain BC52" /LENGTH=191 /DNA_ID=CAMNT_0026893363 /DNA_START=863 /DNA_END=1438 /DNA_ORIENTATION=-